MVCKFKRELVNCHALFQRSFFAIFKTDQYLSVVLKLLQNNSSRFLHRVQNTVKLLSKRAIVDSSQRCSQNLKEVPQNFTEVFNVDDVTANDVFRETNITKKKNKLEFHSNH